MKRNRERRVAYKIVMDDLYVEREQLNRAIEAVETILNKEAQGGGASIRKAFAAAEKGSTGSMEEETRGTLIDAIKTVLRRSDRPLSNGEIFRKLKAAGIKFRSSNPQLSVSQVLSRNSRTTGAPVSVGRGKWTLQ